MVRFGSFSAGTPGQKISNYFSMWSIRLLGNRMAYLSTCFGPDVTRSSRLIRFGSSSSVPRYPPSFGLGADRGCKQNHIIRKILRVTVSEELVGRLKVSELREYCPDEGDHMANIPGDWTGETVHNHFSNAVPMVACWTCLADHVPAELRDTFENASPRDLRRIQHQLLKDHDGVAPNLVTLARALGHQPP